MKIEITKEIARFIDTAIQYQLESGLIYQLAKDGGDWTEKQQNEFHRKLSEFRKSLGLGKSMRQRIMDGEFNEGKIKTISLSEKEL